MLKIIGDGSTSGAAFDIEFSTPGGSEYLDGEGGIKTTPIYSKQSFENFENSFSASICSIKLSTYPTMLVTEFVALK